METGDSTTGHRNEHQRPNRHLFRPGRMQVLQCQFRHRVPADTKEHTAHNAQSHDNQTDAKNRIETGNQLINRKQRCQEIIGQHTGQNNRNRNAGKLGQKPCRPRHKYRTDKYQQHYGEHTHNHQHSSTHMMPDDLGDTLAILAQGNHPRQIVMDSSGKNRTKDNPKINAWPPDCTTESTKDRPKAGNI